MSTHFIEKCRHGVVVTQCRCSNKNKSVRIVECPSNCPSDFKDIPLSWSTK